MNFRMNEFEAYKEYIALKLHFTSDYDYFKYNGKTNVTLHRFEERKDKYHYKRLAKKYEDSTIREYFIASPSDISPIMAISPPEGPIIAILFPFNIPTV